MSNAVAVKTGTIFGVYMFVAIYCVYMGVKKPRTASQRIDESQQNTGSLTVTWAESEKVEYDRRTSQWRVFNKHTKITDVHSAGEDEVQYDYFTSERVKRIKNKQYTEFLKDRFRTMKKYPPESDPFIPLKMLRKTVHPVNQSNAYDQLIHLVTLPTSQTVSRKTYFYSPLHSFLPTTPNPLLILNPTISFPLYHSAATTAKCSFASHSSSCKKKIKYCAKPPITLKTNLHLSNIQTEGPSHLNVNKGVYLSKLNANPLIGFCADVMQRRFGRFGEEWEGVGVTDDVRKDKHTDVCTENLKTRMKPKKLDEGKKTTKDIRISLTIDARSSFLQDLNVQHLPRSLVLDLIFDLAGLNSLHKHDIIASLVQVRITPLSNDLERYR